MADVSHDVMARIYDLANKRDTVGGRRRDMLSRLANRGFSPAQSELAYWRTLDGRPEDAGRLLVGAFRSARNDDERSNATNTFVNLLRGQPTKTSEIIASAVLKGGAARQQMREIAVNGTGSVTTLEELGNGPGLTA